MPIYEFKCSKCENFFELLVMKQSDEKEVKCTKCGSEEFERVLSTTNYAVGGKSGQGSGVKSNTRTCSSGSCTSWDVPGYSR